MIYGDILFSETTKKSSLKRSPPQSKAKIRIVQHVCRHFSSNRVLVMSF